ASAIFVVNPFSPTIAITPGAASDGSNVTLTGSGFNPSDLSCTFTSAPQTVWLAAPAGCPMSPSGQFSATFQVANGYHPAPPGTYTITVIGSTGDAAEVNFVVSGAPTNSIQLIPAAAGRGSTVGFNGSISCGISAGSPPSGGACISN